METYILMVAKAYPDIKDIRENLKKIFENIINLIINKYLTGVERLCLNMTRKASPPAQTRKSNLRSATFHQGERVRGREK